MSHPTAVRRARSAPRRDGRHVLLGLVLLSCTAAGAGLALLLDDALIATAIAACLVAVLLSLLAPALSMHPARA